jgi:hypothetical protein
MHGRRFAYLSAPSMESAAIVQLDLFSLPLAAVVTVPTEHAHGYAGSASSQGRIAEFKLCVLLETWGYRCLHVDEPGFDVIARVPIGSVRIQCKSSAYLHGSRRSPSWNLVKDRDSRSVRRSGGFSRYTSLDTDLLALYWRPTDTFLFMRVDRIAPTYYSVTEMPTLASEVQQLSFDAAWRGLAMGGASFRSGQLLATAPEAEFFARRNSQPVKGR